MKKIIGLFLLLVLSLTLVAQESFAATASAFTLTDSPATNFAIVDANKLIMDIALPNAAADTTADCDGSATTTAGACSATNGTALVAVVVGDLLCADSKITPLVIFKDSDGNCSRVEGTITNILNTAGAGTAVVVGDKWAHTGAGAYATTGQELYVDTDVSLLKNADKLSSVTVSNAGTATDADLSAIKIYQESGTAGFDYLADTLIGSDTVSPFLGLISTGSSTFYVNAASVTTSNRRIYIAADISSPSSNVTFQARIALGAATISMTQGAASANSGPTDAALTNTSVQTIVRKSTGDFTAPTSLISSPVSGATLVAGADYTITGASSDTGGSSVQKAEISFDNGATWSLVASTTATATNGFNWQYVWKNPAVGSYTLKTLATDWFGNREVAGAGVTVIVATPAPVVVVAPVVPVVPVVVPVVTPVVPVVPTVSIIPAVKVSPFAISMFRGSLGTEVKKLQEVLARDKEIYPEGLVTNFFGSLTRAAVGRFQIKYGILKTLSDDGYGFVGPRTRAKLNELYAK